MITESQVVFTAPGKSARSVPIRINGNDANFWCKADDIAIQLVEPVSSFLLDVLDVASAVFFADTSFRRGGDTRARLGEGWGRNLSFNLSVRHPEIWAQSNVQRALCDAVEFLTDDKVSFRFTGKDSELPAEPYLPFAEDGDRFEADEVILFSGGLDSLAGALESLTLRLGKVILVTHRSAQKAVTRQQELGEFVKKKFGGRVLHIHIRATRAATASSESTQRSRSFLFASLGYVVARMAGANRLSFYENGVVSQNLPISPQVIGTMASRTTHPLALRKINAFFDALGEPEIAIRNDFEWLTKTDVVGKIRELGGAKAIASSVSCTKLRSESSHVHHCGACSQCLDRRFAILAAGLEEYEQVSDYKVDVLHETRESGRSRTMALEWTRHALRISEMDVMSFAERFTGELVRITEAYSDSLAETVQRSFDLQRRHGLAIRSVLAKEVAKRADEIAGLQLPDTSLLSLVIGLSAQHLPGVEDSLTEAPPPLEPSAHREDPSGLDIFPLRVAFYDDGKSPCIEIDSLGCVRDAPAAVAHDLKSQYDKDLAAGLAPENHNFVSSSDLAKMRRHVALNTIHQTVRRCRRELAELYQAIELRPPERDLLIENRRPKGYRLDPMIRVICRDQMRDRDSGRH